MRRGATRAERLAGNAGPAYFQAMTPDATVTWALPEPYDFFETTRLLRLGGRDPTVRREPDGLWRTTRNADGAATVRLTVGTDLRAEAWGSGAARAVTDVPAWLGLDEPRWELPAHPVTDALLASHPGLRGTDTRDAFEALTSVVLQQKVTWVEAATTWRRLCEALGEPAPGPGDLRLAPTPRALRTAGTTRLLDLGVGLQRARTLIEVARAADFIREAVERPTAEAVAELQRIRGVGPWSAASLLGMRCARPEPIPTGDYHLPNTIAWALAGEARGTEERMLELLAPFEGRAFRVIRLVFAAHIRAPKLGPRRPLRRRF